MSPLCRAIGRARPTFIAALILLVAVLLTLSAGVSYADDATARDADGAIIATQDRLDPDGWRLTKDGWQHKAFWPKASKPTPAIWRFHPALLALLMAGVSIGALVAMGPTRTTENG